MTGVLKILKNGFVEKISYENGIIFLYTVKKQSRQDQKKGLVINSGEVYLHVRFCIALLLFT